MKEVNIELVYFLADLAELFYYTNNKSLSQQKNAIQTFLAILLLVSFTE